MTPPTKRQREVIRLAGEGKNAQEIAAALKISRDAVLADLAALPKEEEGSEPAPPINEQAARRAFAFALRRRRSRLGLSQEALASKGFARSHVSDMERGKVMPKLTSLVALAEALEVSPAAFMRDIERAYLKLAKQ